MRGRIGPTCLTAPPERFLPAPVYIGGRALVRVARLSGPVQDHHSPRKGHRALTFTDQALICRDCGSDFVFTAADQTSYAQRGYQYFPSRCPSCMAARRARNPNGAATHQASHGGREQRQLYPAICAECGQPTQVPFQPRTEKPIYCSDCFSRRQRANPRG